MTRTSGGAGPALRARIRPRRLAAGLVLLLAGAAEATVIYRCGADGRTLSDLPCAEGARLAAPASPPMLGEGEAQRVAAQQARHAEQLRRERLVREGAVSAGSGGIAPKRDTPASQPASGGKRRAGKKAASDAMAEGPLTPPLRGEPASAR